MLNKIIQKIKHFLRNIRDTKIVLSCLVWMLNFARRNGIALTENYYRHVPYRGLVKVELKPGHHFKIVARGGHIENSLYWEGTYLHEAVSMQAWIDCARDARVVLDIGANSGVFALAAAAMGAKQVHAFEPLPRVNKILCENLSVNSLSSLKAWSYAISNNSGEAELFDPGGEAPTSASLSSHFIKTRFNDGLQTIRVLKISIDSFCLEREIGQVDLIKIDVEGHEEFVLRGMVQTVMMYKPVILIEVLEEYDLRLKYLVQKLFEGEYCWERINDGKEQKSLNVLLTPNCKNI